jgi:hypothetical protein
MIAVLSRALFAVALAASLGACETVKRIPSQVGDLGARVGGWFSFGGADTAIADDPHVIVLPLTGTDWLGRPALAEEIARLLRATTPNARAGTSPDRQARTLEGQVETIEEGDAVVWFEIAWAYRGRDGAAIPEYRQIAAMDRKLWDRAAPAAVQMIASEIAPKAAALLRNESPRLVAAVSDGNAPRSARAGPPGAPARDETPGRRAGTGGGDLGFGGEVASNQPVAAAPPLPPARLPFESAAAPPPPPPPQASYTPTAPPTYPPAPSSQGWPAPPPPVREIASAPVAPVQGSPLSSAWANPVILVRLIEGAPGYGNQALMLAIKQALRVRNFMVTEDIRQAVFSDRRQGGHRAAGQRAPASQGGVGGLHRQRRASRPRHTGEHDSRRQPQ